MEKQWSPRSLVPRVTCEFDLEMESSSLAIAIDKLDFIRTKSDLLFFYLDRSIYHLNSSFAVFTIFYLVIYEYFHYLFLFVLLIGSTRKDKVYCK